MNGAYSNLINNIPGQLPITDQLLNNYGSLSNSQISTTETPLLSQLYNPHHSVAQSRLLSTLHGQSSSVSIDNPNSPNPSQTNRQSSPNDDSNEVNPSKLNDQLSTPQINPSFPSIISLNNSNNDQNNGDLDLNHNQQSSNVPPVFYNNSQLPHSVNNFVANNNTNNICCDINSAWRSAAHLMTSEHNPYLAYENPGWANPYGCIGNPSLDLNTARRKNATRESTSTLKAWLQEHIKNPYPTKGEKIMLAILTKMTLTQVSTWFANARRRLKKENKMTWSPKNRSDDDNSSEPDVHGNNTKNLKDCDNIENECIKKEDHMDSVSDNDEVRGKFSSPNLHSVPNDLKPKIWSLAHTATSNPFGNGPLNYPPNSDLNHGPLSLVGNLANNHLGPQIPPPLHGHQHFLDNHLSLSTSSGQYNYHLNLPPPHMMNNNPPYHQNYPTNHTPPFYHHHHQNPIPQPNFPSISNSNDLINSSTPSTNNNSSTNIPMFLSNHTFPNLQPPPPPPLYNDPTQYNPTTNPNNTTTTDTPPQRSNDNNFLHLQSDNTTNNSESKDAIINCD